LFSSWGNGKMNAKISSMKKTKLVNEVLMKKLQDTKWDSKAKRISTRIKPAHKDDMLEEYEKRLKYESSEVILEELSAKYDRSSRQIANYIRDAREERKRKIPSPTLSLVDQKELDQHWQDLKRLSQRLRTELHLPLVEHSFIEDFGEAGSHEKYSSEGHEVLFLWEMMADNGVIRLLGSVEQEVEVRHLFSSLREHLANSEFSDVLQSLDNRRVKGGEYLSLCNKLYLTVAKEITKRTGTEVPSSIDGEGFGVTKQFVLTICVDAVNRASGLPQALNFEYTHELLCKDIYGLRFGASSITLAPSANELGIYEEMHKELRAEYGEVELSKGIAKLSGKVRNLEVIMSSELQRFSLIVPLPGYCELCKKAIGLQ